jgi:hypothetical protein
MGIFQGLRARRMNVKNAATAVLRWSRHGLRAVRSLSPVAAFGLVAAVVLGGAGVASAANGGNFILGHSNTETVKSTLSNSNGTPLQLNASAGNAPLKVNSSVQVPGLNASEVGGLTSSKLVAGGDGFTKPGTNTPISSTGAGTEVASTGALAAGTYYVTATVLLDVAAGDVEGLCYMARGSALGTSLSTGGASHEGIVQAAETVAVSVTAGDTLQEWCLTGGTHGTVAYNAGITAVRVLSSSGTTPAHAAHSRAARPGR